MAPAVPPIPSHIAAPPWPVLQAPPHWRQVDFISDLHLQASESATFSAWQNFMQTTQADAVFILGDLFEVWIGDDVIDGNNADPAQTPCFEARCAEVIKAASQRFSIFFMHGNRDFLLGSSFAKTTGITLLEDPSVLDFASQRWLMSHGDALCLQDTDYLKFRSLVRSATWQQEFLAKPLPERQAIARSLRIQSETLKQDGAAYADIDTPTACGWLSSAKAQVLIHGHTHKPADHDLSGSQGQQLRRIVLSDWDASATPRRAEVLRLSVASPPSRIKV